MSTKNNSLSNLLGSETLESEMKIVAAKVQQIKNDCDILTKITWADEEQHTILKNCMTMQKNLAEKVYSRYVLFPDSDRIITKNMLEAQVACIKVIKSFKRHLDFVSNEFQRS